MFTTCVLGYPSYLFLNNEICLLSHKSSFFDLKRYKREYSKIMAVFLTRHVDKVNGKSTLFSPLANEHLSLGDPCCYNLASKIYQITGKPNIALSYNSTKGGVAAMDQMARAFTVQSKCFLFCVFAALRLFFLYH